LATVALVVLALVPLVVTLVVLLATGVVVLVLVPLLEELVVVLETVVLAWVAF
jgi:hypothetical protein